MHCQVSEGNDVPYDSNCITNLFVYKGWKGKQKPSSVSWRLIDRSTYLVVWSLNLVLVEMSLLRLGCFIRYNFENKQEDMKLR